MPKRDHCILEVQVSSTVLRFVRKKKCPNFHLLPFGDLTKNGNAYIVAFFGIIINVNKGKNDEDFANETLTKTRKVSAYVSSSRRRAESTGARTPPGVYSSYTTPQFFFLLLLPIPRAAERPSRRLCRAVPHPALPSLAAARVIADDLSRHRRGAKP